MKRLIALTALAFTCAWTSPARAGHAAAERLKQRISVSFIETPVERAVQEIGRLANVAVVVDAAGLGERGRRFPVSLELAKAPAREALDLIAKDAGIGYSLDGHVVFVSTRAKARAGEIVLRTYDVRDLTFAVSNFPGPDFTLTRHAARTGMGPITLDEPPPEALVASGSLADLIMSRLRPEEWGAELGTSIEERSGYLIVVQVKEVHDEIARLIDDLREAESLFIGLESWAFLAEPGVIDGAVRNAAAPGFLSAAELRRAMAVLAERGAERLGSARTICMNNQRVHVMTGRLTNYVAGVDVSGKVLDPIMGQVFEGFNIDVAPIASHDRRFVTLTATIDAPAEAAGAAAYTVISGPSILVAESGSGEEWSVEKKGDDLKVDKSAGSGVVPSPAPARIQQVDQEARNVATQVQVPRGCAAVFTVPAVRDKAAIFVVRPTIIGEPQPRRYLP